MKLGKILHLSALGLLASGIMPAASAATYPDRPITIIVPYGAGGTTDIFVRALGDALGRELKQAVVVENKAGANGTMGLISMKSAKPDGYSLTIVPISAFRQPYIQKTSYDPIKDATYVSMVGSYNYAIGVNATSQWKTIQELIDYTKKNPNTVFYGVNGRYSVTEFIMMDLAKKLDLKWTSVPFKGDSQNISSLLGDQVQAVSATNAILPFAQSGRVRILATTGEKRTKDFPNAPTLKEAGYPLTMTTPFGIAGPAGMPEGVVKTLDTAIAGALKDPKFVEAVARYGIDITYMDHAAYTTYAKDAAVNEKDSVKTLLEGAVKN